MPLDAVCLQAVVHELNAKIAGGRIEKVYQPERDEVVLSIRGIQGARRLLISTASGASRMHFIDNTRENPAAPPMFCMLLRKHVQGAKIASITQPALERIAVIELDTNDEMGVASKKYLVCELMGNFSNIILNDSDGRIIDALRRVEGDMSGKRKILPGLFYHMPPVQENKRNPLEVSGSGLAAAAAGAEDAKGLDKWLLGCFYGLSPLLCREIAYRATGDASKPVNSLTKQDLETLSAVFTEFTQQVQACAGTPCLLSRPEDQTVFDFSSVEIRQYEGMMLRSALPSFSDLLSAFYEKKGRAERMRRRAQDMLRIITNARDRLARKLALQEQELAQTQNRDTYKRMGDLITANLYQLEKGARTAKVVDYYAEGCPEIEIQMDIRLTPQQNAQRYFKRYNKAKTAESMLTEQIKIGNADLQYLESVLEAIGEAESEQDLAQLREELLQTGFLSAKQQRGRKNHKPAPVKAIPFHYRTSDGFDVFAGKNNLQNDILTLKTAYKNDIWFHTQKIHGSHVILVTDGKEPTDTAMTEAACIAAYHSKARNSAMVPVDYSEVRNIKKPAGAKPGMVIYHVYKTAYVTPVEAEIEKLRQK